MVVVVAVWWVVDCKIGGWVDECKSVDAKKEIPRDSEAADSSSGYVEALPDNDVQIIGASMTLGFREDENGKHFYKSITVNATIRGK